MTHRKDLMKRKITLPALAAAIAVVVAGCGGYQSSSQSSSAPYGSAVSPKPPGRAATKVAVANSSLGRIIVDGKGNTLYLFENDKGRASTCYAGCASAWPPLTVTGKLTAGHGVAAGELGTTKRKDGSLEATYNGHPLYHYAGDAQRGETNGQGLDQFGAAWYVLAPSGKKIDRD
jgi:predicted lipoprotein with Yx(FWY)xxD motif